MLSFSRFLVVATCCAALPLAGTWAQAPRKPAPKPVPKPAAKPTPKPAPPVPPVRTAPPASPPPPAPVAAAADAPFEVGTNVINLGIGLGSHYGYGMGLLGGSSTVSPALSVSYERGVLDAGLGIVGLGAFLGYQNATYRSGTLDKWKYNDLILTLRGTFHYPLLPQLDTYGGANLGLRHASASYQGSTPNTPDPKDVNEVALGLFAGARYFLLPNFGAFAELGFDYSYLKIGLTGKF